MLALKKTFTMLKAALLHCTTVFLAPILYHAPTDGLIACTCVLFYEFVDTYSSLILALLFVGALVLLKNAMFHSSLAKYTPSTLKSAYAELQNTKNLRLVTPAYNLFTKAITFFKNFK